MTTCSGLFTFGEVSVKLVSSKLPENSWRVLILGPTGSGKSSLIEALAGENQTLSISRNQLASFTQHVGAYKLVNVFHDAPRPQPIYLIDSPGFSDGNISEIEIMSMLRVWLQNNGIYYFDRILYLSPINETRLSGSKRRTINMLRSFLEPTSSFAYVTVVTTMWDTLHNQRMQQRAEMNYVQLRDEIWKDFLDAGATIRRFTNSKASALHVLSADRTWTNPPFLSQLPNIPNLYCDLHERIMNRLQEKKALEIDLEQPDTQSDPELISILQLRLDDVKQTLSKFICQLNEFDSHPSTGFEGDMQRLQEAVAAANLNVGRLERYGKGLRQSEGNVDRHPPADTTTVSPNADTLRITVLKSLFFRFLNMAKAQTITEL